MTHRRKWKNRALKLVVNLFGGAVVLGATGLVLYILLRGLSSLSLDVLTSQPSLLFGTMGIMPAIANTFLMMLAAGPLAMLLGILASFWFGYIKSYRLRCTLEWFLTTVAELPTVVYGLLGMLVFCQWCGMGVSFLAGTLTMVVMLGVEVLSQSTRHIPSVSWRRRKQALSLGASRGELIQTIMVPESLPIMVAGTLRAMARVAAETMALLLTVGAGTQLAEGLVSAFLQSGGTLSVMMYIYVQQRGDTSIGFTIAALLLLIIGGLVVASNLCVARLNRRYK